VAGTHADLRMLEVGCGPGANLWYLANEDYTIAGIDGSETAIAQARSRLRSDLPSYPKERADLRVGNFAVLPWADGQFDLVLDIEAVYANRLDVIRATIAEMHRVLRPGGRLFALMFGRETTGIMSGEPLEPGTTRNPVTGPLAGTGLTHAFERNELIELFSNFSDLTLDWVRRTVSGGEVEIFEWVVSARK